MTSVPVVLGVWTAAPRASSSAGPAGRQRRGPVRRSGGSWHPQAQGSPVALHPARLSCLVKPEVTQLRSARLPHKDRRLCPPGAWPGLSWLPAAGSSLRAARDPPEPRAPLQGDTGQAPGLRDPESEPSCGAAAAERHPGVCQTDAASAPAGTPSAGHTVGQADQGVCAAG